MNKKELVNAIAAEAKLTKVQAAAALDAALKAVGEALAKGDKVALIGFGTFAVAEKAARTGVNPATKVKERAARTGRKPSTGETIEIPAKKVVKFKAGAELAAKVK